MEKLILSTTRIIAVVIIAFLTLFISFIITDIIPNTIVQAIIWTLAYSLMTFTATYLLQVKLDKSSMKAIEIGFSRNLIKALIPGLGIGIITFSLILLAELIFGFIKPLSLFGDWEIPSRCIALLIEGFISCLGIAIGEEIIYRGYLFEYLKKEYGLLVGVILSSVVFSAVHIPDGNRTLLHLINIVIIGILLALITDHYKSIWAPIGFHWIWNFLQMYVFPVSTDSYTKGLLRFIPVSSQGSAGPEYGFLTTVIITVVSIVFIIITVRNPKNKIPGHKHAPLIKKGGLSIIFIYALIFISISTLPNLLGKTQSQYKYRIKTIDPNELHLEKVNLDINIAPSSNMASNQVMAPVAWMKSTGRNVSILQTVVKDTTDQVSSISHETTSALLKEIAPHAKLETITIDPELKTSDGFTLINMAELVDANIIIIYQPLTINETHLLTTVKTLIKTGYTVIIRQDAAFTKTAGNLFKNLSQIGAICVGDLSPEGLIPDQIGTRSPADIYAPYGTNEPYFSSLVSAGIAALVIENMDHQTQPHQIKDRLIKSSIKHYQVYDITTGTIHEDLYEVNFQGEFTLIATSREKPLEYTVVNAPRAVGIDINSSDWILTALNIPDAWSISTGKGVQIAVLASGFQLETPELENLWGEGACFHDYGYRNYSSYQGTILSQIVATIAPNVTIMPILIDDSNIDRVQAAIGWAVQKEADIILMALHHGMNTQKIHSSIDHAINKGTIVIWNSYTGENTEVLKSGYIEETEHVLSGLYEERSEIPTTYLGERFHPAAQLAGITALIREIDPDITPQELQELLTQTASQTGDQYFPNVWRAVTTRRESKMNTKMNTNMFTP